MEESNCFGFVSSGFQLIVPEMPPVCVVIGNPLPSEDASCMNAIIPSFVIYSAQKEVLVACPGDVILIDEAKDKLLMELCMESKKRHEGWNPHAMMDAIMSFRTLGYDMKLSH